MQHGRHIYKGVFGPLHSSYLLGCQLDLVPGSLLFQFQQSLILRPHGVLVGDLPQWSVPIPQRPSAQAGLKPGGSPT